MRCHLRLLVVAVLASTSLVCRAPVEPPTVAAAYVLRMVQDDVLPALYSQNETATVTVVADTLRLLLGGDGEEHVILQRASPGSLPPEQRLDVERQFKWTLADTRIEIEYACPPNALCVAPPHLVGQISDDGLVITYALGARVPQHFERIGE